jgi:hypothetical protein
LIVSIDVHLNGNQTSLAEKRLLDQGMRQLLASLDSYGMPATFAIPHAATHNLTEAIVTSRVGHEIAVLGDSSWTGAQVGRGPLARELTHQLSEAREHGLHVSTLALHDASLTRHFDLLVKQSISALRRDPRSGGRAVCLQEPTNVRFGLRQHVASCCLPTRDRRKFRAGHAFARARRAVKQAAGSGKTVHMAIDGTVLVQRQLADLAAIDGVLRYAATLHDTRRLAVETIQDRTRKLALGRAASPARSILRPAA